MVEPIIFLVANTGLRQHVICVVVLPDFLYKLHVTGSGFAPAAVSAGSGKQVFWNAAQPHGVRDSSGLRLFNSGLLPAGGSYGYAYKVATGPKPSR